MNLYKKLELWHQEGLMTEQQIKNIKDYENKGKKSKLLYMLYYVATFCIGVGIISLIASNWSNISYQAKLTIDILLLGAVAYGIYYCDEGNKSFWKEALIFLYAILIIASMGLVAQVFHIAPSGYKGIMFWSVMVIPLLFVTKKQILSFVWYPIAMCSVVACLVSEMYLIEKFFIFIGERESFIFFIIYIFMCFLFITYLKKIEFFKNSNMLKTIWFYNILSVLVVLFFMEFGSLYYYIPHRLYLSEIVNSNYYALLSFCLFIIASAIGIAYLNRDKSDKYDYALVAALMLFYLLGGGFLSTIVVLSILALYSVSKQAYQLFNFISFLIMLRIFILYVQLVYGLMHTGILLILSGVVLLGFIKIWHVLSKKGIANMKERYNG